MSEQISKQSPWWGEFDVPHGSIGRWRIGPTDLWIQRLRGEWRLASVPRDESGAASGLTGGGVTAPPG